MRETDVSEWFAKQHATLQTIRGITHFSYNFLIYNLKQLLFCLESWPTRTYEKSVTFLCRDKRTEISYAPDCQMGGGGGLYRCTIIYYDIKHYHDCTSGTFKLLEQMALCTATGTIFLKSAWRHSVIGIYDKARNNPYSGPWHLGDKLCVYRWPQCNYNKRFCKSNCRLSKIATGNRCKGRRTSQNLTNLNLRDPVRYINDGSLKNRIFHGEWR